MSAKHTPGQWEAVSGTSNGWEVRAKIGSHNFAEFTTKADAMIPVFIEPWSRFQPDSYKEMMAANFKLAAAAPELLEAMRFILAFYEPGQTHLDTNAWKQAEAAARAAIAKATGEPA